MPARCIFCGKFPIDKNKEHVLPRWLIEMTGDSKRPLKIPFCAGLRKGLPDSLAFDSLKFPACARCNSDYSQLEDQAKVIVSRMLQFEELDSQQLNTFLNWLDKVRTGLWLGILALIGNPTNIQPKFHIAARVAAKDRMVVIHRCEAGPTGLSVFGTNLPIFWYYPVCFSLMINHLSFLNASTDFLISRRLGFPYPEKLVPKPDGSSVAEMARGTERYLLPLIRMPYNQDGTEIFQPMFHHSLSLGSRDSFSGLYDTEYVERHSISHSDGIGKIILQKERSIIFYEGPSAQWQPHKQHKFEDLLRFVPIQTLKLQNHLAEAEVMTNSQNELFSRLKNLNRQEIERVRKAEIRHWRTR
jgi:hypothetical protein